MSTATLSAADIAKTHFSAALAETSAKSLGVDAMCRAMLGLVVEEYLRTRGVEDVQSELRFIAENCDPDSEFAFMRP